MFDFKRDHTFTWPVKVLTPQMDGSHKEEIFKATWLEQDSHELAAYQAAHPKGSGYALIEKALKGIEGITLDGKPMELNEQTLPLLAGSTRISLALAHSYWDAVNGKAHEKN